MITTSKVQHPIAREEVSDDVKPERRRERRINLAFSIELFGFNSANHYFTERSVTTNISKGGCQLRLKNQVEVRSVLAIRIALPEGSDALAEKPMLFLVAWLKRAGAKWAAGALALQPETIWPVSVPEKPSAGSEH